MSDSRYSRSGKQQRGFVRCDYDALNSETFGDTGASGEDWMAGHDAFVNARAADTKSTVSSHKEEQDLSDSLSQQMKIKELWPTSPAQPSKPNDSIWSSPEIPHRTPATVIGSPALPVGHKIMRVEDLEQEYSTPPPPQTTPTSQATPTNPPLGPPPGLRMPTQPPIRLPPHFLLGHPQMLPPGFPPFMRPHPQHLAGFPPPPGPTRPPLLPPSAFHRPPHHRGPFTPPPQTDMAPRKSRRSEYLGEMKSDGSGFMTQKEKEWVIKIQLIQLQSSDPTNEDYYYMNYVRRKQQRASNQLSHNQQSDQPDETQILALPNIAHSEHKYQPAEFSGALGKLTVSSVGAPRKRIDVSVGGDPGKEVKVKKQAFIVIEKLYSEVLSLEELESKASAIAVEDRAPMLASRDKSRADMITLLQLRSTAVRTELTLFYQVMVVRKGKRLINRMLPLLTDDQAKTVVLAILSNLPPILKKDSSDQVLSELNKTVSAIIATFDLPTVNVCLHSVMDGLLKIAQSEFGAGLINSLLMKGHTLATDHQTDHTQTWHTLSAELCRELVSHKEQLSPSKPSVAVLLATLNSL